MIISNIGYNNINSDGGIAIAESLVKNQTLTHLDLCNIITNILIDWVLGGNNIEVAGGKEFAATLMKNKTLTSLNLGKL